VYEWWTAGPFQSDNCSVQQRYRGLGHSTHLLGQYPLAPLPGPWADFKTGRWGIPAHQRVRMHSKITLRVGTQHACAVNVGALVVGDKPAVELGREHGRLSETLERREKGYIDGRGFTGKTGDVDWVVMSSPPAYK